MQNSLTEHDALLVLNALPHVGPVSYKAIIQHLDISPGDIFSCSKSQLMQVPGIGARLAQTILDWPSYFNLESEKNAILQKNAAFIPITEHSYPSLLTNIYDPPIGLYALGPYRPQEKCIAIVGSRRCTLYGKSMARRFAADLANLGFCIISGMARGIDTEAHLGALDANGKTVAVLGSGLNIIYPPENKNLYHRIAESGAVMSEFSMNRPADRQTFPMRNRLVSGIAQAVIVVETDKQGGSMITAKIATEQGRHVFAVPGRIDQSSSHGCHQLIREGVSLLTSIDDLLQEISYLRQLEFNLDPSSSTKPMHASPNLDLLDDLEVKIVKTIHELGNATPDSLSESLSIPSHQLSAKLLMLELKKKLKKLPDASFELLL